METTENKPLFEIRDLSVHYGDRKVLDGVTTDIPEKQVTAVLGPSGCGKSTMLRAMNRTLELTPHAKISHGSIMYKGENILTHPDGPRAMRKRVGIAQQRPLPFPMSIEENVLFGLNYHEKLKTAEKKESVEKTLKRVALWDEVKDRLRSPGSALSIGQQQRLCIGRSLANRPEALLMDEPCSALDPASTAKIEELIRQLRGEITVVIVTHNIAQAKRISTRSIFFLNGAIAEQGDTEQVISRPTNPRVRAIMTGNEG